MLLKPLITEQSLARAQKKSYTFIVTLSDTKTQIKKEVETTFGVKVIKVHTATMTGQSYRSGKGGQRAFRGDWKKAIVTIKSDQKIDLFETPAAA